MTRLDFASLMVGLFGVGSVMVNAGMALVEGRPTVRAMGFAPGLAGAEAPEPPSRLGPSGGIPIAGGSAE